MLFRSLYAKDEDKSKNTIQYLGCDIKTLKAHIESKFASGMTMEKVMKREIEIHHRIPPGRVMHDCPEKFYQSLRYENLEPMWAEENRRRSSFIWPDVALEAITWGIKLKPFEIKKARAAGVSIPGL